MQKLQKKIDISMCTMSHTLLSNSLVKMLGKHVNKSIVACADNTHSRHFALVATAQTQLRHETRRVAVDALGSTLESAALKDKKHHDVNTA